MSHMAQLAAKDASWDKTLGIVIKINRQNDSLGLVNSLYPTPTLNREVNLFSE